MGALYKSLVLSKGDKNEHIVKKQEEEVASQRYWKIWQNNVSRQDNALKKGRGGRRADQRSTFFSNLDFIQSQNQLLYCQNLPQKIQK